MNTIQSFCGIGILLLFSIIALSVDDVFAANHDKPPPKDDTKKGSHHANSPPTPDELKKIRVDYLEKRFKTLAKEMDDTIKDKLQSKYDNLKSGNLPNLDNKISPHHQLSIGINVKDIICTGERELVLRTSNGLPACVTSNTASTLVARGYATPITGISIPTTGVNNPSPNTNPPPVSNGTGVNNPPPNTNPPPVSNGTGVNNPPPNTNPPPVSNGTGVNNPPPPGNYPPVNGTGQIHFTISNSTYIDSNGNTMTISGGHETDAIDGGRPVYLIGSMLGITGEQFRDAFSYVTPEENGHLNEETAQANKVKLLAQLEPYGITNDEIDETTNYYRYYPGGMNIWPYTHAVLDATISNGTVTSFEIVSGGDGYTSEPIVTVDGYGDIAVDIIISYTDSFETNGAITAITVQ